MARECGGHEQDLQLIELVDLTDNVKATTIMDESRGIDPCRVCYFWMPRCKEFNNLPVLGRLPLQARVQRLVSFNECRQLPGWPEFWPQERNLDDMMTGFEEIVKSA